VAIVRATRENHGFSTGAGPRGSIALIRAARGVALLGGRAFVTPDDIKRIALPALRHRVTTSPEAEIEGFTADSLLTTLLDAVPAPRV
jgi:MoxR-like ATPase